MNPIRIRPDSTPAGVSGLARKPLYLVFCALFCSGGAEAGMVTSCVDNGTSGTLRYQVEHDSSADLSQLTCSTITLTRGAIPYNDLILQGPTDHRLTIVGNGTDRLLRANNGGSILSIFDLELSGGRIVGDTPYLGGGACVLAWQTGTVYLKNTVVRDCRSTVAGGVIGGAIYTGYIKLAGHSDVADNPQVGAAGNAGGAIWSNAFVCYDSSVRNNSLSGSNVSAGGVYTRYATLDHCTIEGNSPGGLHVAVPKYTNRVTKVTASTISGNTDWGLEVDEKGTLDIVNSTISGNGGGVSAFHQTVTIANSTVVGNANGVGSVGGFYSAYGLSAQSSIFAHNVPYDVYLWQSNFAGADNLVMYTNATDPVSGSSVDAGTIVSSADPRLAPLAFHGGETRTHALLAGSPALDHGNNSANLGTDQRGQARASPAGKPDIGAYERQPVDDELFYDGFDGGG